uniref:Uncharacterized protein n=1 Tax=Branchiostoma floridae TaxID=7739 RepID=C3ZN65_BRAFL|eukprot:XP_002590017.1 hypothetical protein BRAFLDRAFT_81639 [Branchiostoma floridae]
MSGRTERVRYSQSPPARAVVQIETRKAGMRRDGTEKQVKYPRSTRVRRRLPEHQSAMTVSAGSCEVPCERGGCSTRYDTPSRIKVVYRGFSASAPEEIALRIERGVRRCSRSPRMVAASGPAGLPKQPYACHSEGGATLIVAFWAGF